MKTDPPRVSEDKMTQYLLGELSEAERASVEDACLADEECFEQLLAVEAELMDDYVRGVLTGPQREYFEERQRNLLGWRDELYLARSITKSDGPVRLKNSFGWNRLGRAAQISLAAAALLLLCFGAWAFWTALQGRTGDEELAREEQPPVNSATPQPTLGASQPSPNQSEQPSPTPTAIKSPVSTPDVVTLALVSSFERGEGGANDLVIPHGAGKVRLSMTFSADDYQSYVVTLKSVDGKEILTRRNLKARTITGGRRLILELSADALPEGDFILSLNGTRPEGKIEDINKYFLSIRKSK